MKWASDCLDKVNSDVLPAGAISSYITETELWTSGAFSGIGAPENSDAVIQHIVKSWLNEHYPDLDPSIRPINFKSAFAIEVNKKAQA